MKHTQGPWAINDNTADQYGQLTVESQTDGAVAICYTMERYDVSVPAECVANARLIAAAPDLLIALRALLEDAIELGIYELKNNGSAVAAQNAIYKATGGAA